MPLLGKDQWSLSRQTFWASLLSVTLAYPDWRQQSERLPVPAAMASADLILAGLHLHHLERGDSDLFPESTFPPLNREHAHNGNSAIEGPGMLLVG